MIAQKLKQYTSPLHALSEELNFASALTDGSITTADYLLLLKRLHAFFNQIALLQNQQVPRNSIPLSFFQEKTALIEADIYSLEETFIQISPSFHELPYYEYLGFCYVALGSMLGGLAIHRNIVFIEVTKNISLPCSFYSGSKEAVIKYWKGFVNCLATIADNDHEAIINGATTAYLYFIYLSTIIK